MENEKSVISIPVQLEQVKQFHIKIELVLPSKIVLTASAYAHSKEEALTSALKASPINAEVSDLLEDLYYTEMRISRNNIRTLLNTGSNIVVTIDDEPIGIKNIGQKTIDIPELTKEIVLKTNSETLTKDGVEADQAYSEPF